MNGIFDCGYTSIIITEVTLKNKIITINWIPNTNSQLTYLTTTHKNNIVLQCSSNTFSVNGKYVDKEGFWLLRDKLLKIR